LRVHPSRVGLQRLLALGDPFLRRLQASRAEDVALADPFQPVLQLDQVDLVLLQLGVGEVIGVVLLIQLREEVLALVQDLLVLVITGRLELGPDLLLPGEDRAGQQGRGPGHLEDLAPELAHAALGGDARGQRSGGVLQVDGAQALQPAPDGRAEPGGLGRNPVDEQQPAVALLLTSALLHLLILSATATGPRYPVSKRVCERRLSIRLISSCSPRISSSLGDSAIVAVRMNATMLIPSTSGSRKLSAVAPPAPPRTIPAGPVEAYIRIEAMPV